MQVAGLTPDSPPIPDSDTGRFTPPGINRQKKKAGNQLLISSFPAQIALISCIHFCLVPQKRHLEEMIIGLPSCSLSFFRNTDQAISPQHSGFLQTCVPCRSIMCSSPFRNGIISYGKEKTREKIYKNEGKKAAPGSGRRAASRRRLYGEALLFFPWIRNTECSDCHSLQRHCCRRCSGVRAW